MKNMDSINKHGFENWVVNKLKEDSELTKEYIDQAIKNFDKDGNIEILLSALRKAAKAKGWTYLEKETGISRQALYKALSEKGNPRIKTFIEIINSLGYRLQIC